MTMRRQCFTVEEHRGIAAKTKKRDGRLRENTGAADRTADTGRREMIYHAIT